MASGNVGALPLARRLFKTCFSPSGHHGAVGGSEPRGLGTHRVTRSDAELLAAATNDPQAFREFYDRYAVWVRTWLQRQTGSESAALDLTAETFAQAWHSLRRFRDLADGSAAPWLFGIARNLLRQYHKHNRIETAARKRLGLPLAFAESEEYDRVDERISASSLRPALESAVGALPQEQRKALELRVVQQLSYDEVAGRLGCSQNAARLRVSRALRALTLELSGAEG
jgi:RNA polymerase sigma factor (sigma-70 family)